MGDAAFLKVVDGQQALVEYSGIRGRRGQQLEGITTRDWVKIEHLFGYYEIT